MARLNFVEVEVEVSQDFTSDYLVLGRHPLTQLNKLKPSMVLP